MRRVSIFLAVVALIAGTVGCGGAESYALAIASTEGGSVTTPGEGMFTYDEATMVDLTAEADEGYRFVNWAGDVDTIAEANAATTTITVNGSYFITANFVAVYDLTISSTAGGSVTTPGEGTSTYDEGTVVNLVAEAGEGYYFVEWTGDVDTIANVNAASTTITMNGDYYITANFVLAIPAWDWYDLHAIRNNLAGGYLLMNDLDSTTTGYEELAGPIANGGKGWEPIGASDNRFTGILDGQGHEIRDLSIDRPDESYVGLFSYVAEGSTIGDIGVMNVVVTGYDYVGCLAGRNDGTVSNSYSIGSVTGGKHVGGLVGYDLGSTVSNSYYNYDESLINGDNLITIGALYDEDFDQWLANSKSLDVNERLSQENDYYLINDVSDFKQLLAFSQNATLKFRLTNDLDLIDEPNFYIPYLAGEFDGNGNKISNLNLDLYVVSPLGLFGYLALGANLTQVGVENVNITSYRDVGGLVGWNTGTVSNSYSTGSVTGDFSVGGLVGVNYAGTVSNSCFTGGVTGSREVGGLAGHSSGTVSNSHSTGSVVGDDVVGGLVGGNGGTIENSCSDANVIGDKSYVGGLVGLSDGTVSNSCSTGNVTGSGWGVGGLVGYNMIGIVSDSCSTASVVNSGGWGAGGLVGCNYGTLSNSYSVGSLSGHTAVGGLVGDNGGTVSDSYSAGTVCGHSPVGGLVGYNSGTVTNSFWDIETSGQATSGGGTGKTTAEMRSIATFSAAAWNIIAVANADTPNPSYIWNIVEHETYPFLGWQSV